jgi:hypothetical protein
LLSPLQHSIILYSDQSLDNVLKKYDSLGPTARFCFELTTDEIARHTSDRHRAIENTSPDRLKQLFSNSLGLSFDALSHKICLIQRMRGSALGDGSITTDFISVEVEQQVVQWLEKFSDDQLLDMWTNFSKFGDARVMTGSIFEVFVHRLFRKRIYLDATPMVRTVPIPAGMLHSASNDLSLPPFMEWHSKSFLSRLILAVHSSTILPLG